MVVAPLHTITTSVKSFQWGMNQQNPFDEMKRNFIQEPILSLQNMHNPFEVDIDASGYSMVELMMQGGRLVCYQFEVFIRVCLNYATYNKKIYALIQSDKKWKHYLMGKETIIHRDHQSLQYL
jgi:hypothetical protein